MKIKYSLKSLDYIILLTLMFPFIILNALLSVAMIFRWEEFVFFTITPFFILVMFLTMIVRIIVLVVGFLKPNLFLAEDENEQKWRDRVLKFRLWIFVYVGLFMLSFLMWTYLNIPEMFDDIVKILYNYINTQNH